MPLQYQTVAEHDLGLGIDVRSSENLLQPGFFEDAINAEVLERRIKKRPGYQQQSGYVPVRVEQVSYTDSATNNIRLDLNSEINLANIPTTPLIVAGRVSEGLSTDLGQFSDIQDSTHYFTEFTADPRRTFNSPSDIVQLSASNHGLSSNVLFVGVTESLSTSDFSNSVFLPDEIRINKADLSVEISHTNAADFDGFVYFSDRSELGGQNYVAPNTSIPANSTQSIIIPASVHGLENFNVIARVFQDTPAQFIEVIADEVKLDPNNGEVTVQITNSNSFAIDIFPVLTTAPSDNIVNGSVASGNSVTIPVPNFTGMFPILGIYLEDGIGGDLQQVIPDAIVFDNTLGQLDITFTNNTLSDANFEIYYDSGEIITNQVFLTGTPTTVPYEDSNPQLTLWGLNHEEIYDNPNEREGWVNHIDTYRRSGEERLVAGLGGNIYAERTFEEVGNTFNLPRLFPRLNNRIATNTTIGPVFYQAGALARRSRGFITTDDTIANWLEVTEVSYNKTTGYSEYVLVAKNHEALDSQGNPVTVSDVISVDNKLEDYFTVRDMGRASHNGEFRIVGTESVDTNTLKIIVDNPTVNCPDFDEVDAGGLGGIFTDQIEFASPSEFVRGDVLISALFEDTFILEVASSDDSNIVVIRGAVSNLEVPLGLRVTGERSSSIVPLRSGSNSASVENLVVGDIFRYTELDRKLRVKYVNIFDDRPVTLSGDGEFLLVTLDSGSTSDLVEGGNIYFKNSGQFSGEHRINRVFNSNTIEILSSLKGTETGTLLGKYVEVDEVIDWEDRSNNSVAFTIDCRWIPIEAPVDSFEQTNSTYVRHFDVDSYTNQTFLRSTMVNDNMYFINGNDEVMKFDGENVYRAGLFRWQAGLFATIDNTNPGKIVTNTPTIQVTAIEDNQFVVALTDEFKVNIGDRIRYNDGTQILDFTVESRDDNDERTQGRITVNRNINTTNIGTFTRISTYRYYFRLNAIDANDNIVASAVTGSENFRVDVSEDSAIQLKLIGMPAWDIYDYRRLEVEIYRTVADTEAPFYRITNIPMQFNKHDGYLKFTDTTQDEELQDQTQLDIVATSVDSDIANRVNWSEPLRANLITSSNNRLILGNLTDYPELNIQMYDQSNLAENSELDGLVWSFRRDNRITGDIVSTDMTNTARYEWIDVDNANVLSTSLYIQNSLNNTLSLDVGSSIPVGSWVYIYHTVKAITNNVEAIGWHQVIATSGTRITVSYNNSDGVTPTADAAITATQAGDIPVLLGTEGNRDTRTDRNSDILKAIASATSRLAEAINTTMRTAQNEGFTPWMIANAGDEFNAGQLIVRKPRVDIEIPEMIIPTNLPADFDVFINGLRREAGSEAGMTERVYPSRVIQSYSNFPEIFDNPNAVSDSDTENVRDVNAADGQDITGMIPFFGDATSQDSVKEGIVVVFKTNSVYVFNVSNTTEPQRLETQGLGCTAPYSVAASKDGIIFANNSGIYSITRNYRFRYIGSRMERLWLESVNEDQLDLAQGHNFARNRQYKLSVPVENDSQNSEVYVYDHTRETQDTPGGWTRYDNHPATGWANKQSNAFFGSTKGRVFAIRSTGNESDFRDDDQPIHWDVKYRALDFGNAGARKTLISIISHFRNIVNSENTTLEISTDMSNSFEPTDLFNINNNEAQTALSDTENRSIISIRSAVDRRKFLYIQVRYQNTGKDEPVEISGVDFRVALNSRKGITEAKDTTG